MATEVRFTRLWQCSVVGFLFIAMLGCSNISARPEIADKGQQPTTPQVIEENALIETELSIDFLEADSKVLSAGDGGFADGSEFESTFPHRNVSASAPDAQYSGDFSYAIYALEHDVASNWLAVFLEYSSDPTGQEVWVGLSNFEKLRWEWKRTDDWYNMATFEGASGYKSPSGVTYVAVVGWDAEVLLRSVAIDYTGGLGGDGQAELWGTVVGTITGKGVWSYDTPVDAHSNYGDSSYYQYNYVGGYNCGDKWQCVEFCKRFIWRIWNFQTDAMSLIEPWGGQGRNDGAWKWFYQDLRTDLLPQMSRHTNNTSTQPPKEGDVVVWAATSSQGTGHVAVVKSVNIAEGWVACIQQNVYHHEYDGWFLIGLNKNGNFYELTSAGKLGSWNILGWIHYGDFVQAGNGSDLPPVNQAIGNVGIFDNVTERRFRDEEKKVHDGSDHRRAQGACGRCSGN